MSANARKKLEVDDDLDFQRRDWVFERIGWVAMLFVIVAAVAGAFGRGPASDAIAVTEDGSLRIEYGRFERHGSPAALVVHAARRSATDSVLALWIDGAYLRGIQLDAVLPEAERELSSGGGVTYHIALAPATDTATITIHYTPDAIGPRRMRLGVVGRPVISRSQFVYP